jgi:hypothetical protein
LGETKAQEGPMKDAFDLWWEWAQKPHESFLMIDADIHRPIMERPREGQRGGAAISGKSEVQHLNSLGRRTIMCMLWASCERQDNERDREGTRIHQGRAAA